jgi:hypothetical protein
MRPTRVLGLLAGAAAISLAALTVAAPASAATLPPGQKITIVDALDDSGPQEGPFYNVNPGDAAATPVGTGSGAYITGIEVNDDGIGFAIGYLSWGEEGIYATLWDADANTGTVSNPRQLLSPSGDAPDECDGIDLNPITGELLISCVVDTPNGDVSAIFSVNKVSAEITTLMGLGGGDFQEFTALATDPITGILWGFGPFDGDASFIIDLDLQTAEFIAIMDENVYAADFDREGQLFVASDLFDGAEFSWPALGVVDPNTGVFSFHEWFVDTATDVVLFDVRSLTIWGKLAATGSTTGAEALPVALGSALLLLAGAAFIATSRVSRKRS